jgi:predicted nucleic acid-binding protein
MSPEARALVIDASIGITVVRKERGWDRALDTLRRRRMAGSPLLVPSLFWLELVNVLCRRYRLKPAIVIEAIVELQIMGLESVELERPMLPLMLDAVARHSLSAYDAAYLALAESADAELLTSDARLAAAAGRRALQVQRNGLIRERPADLDWQADNSVWADWPGAANYLRELRAPIRATEHPRMG